MIWDDPFLEIGTRVTGYPETGLSRVKIHAVSARG
jgi:hypothetical protein